MMEVVADVAATSAAASNESTWFNQLEPDQIEKITFKPSTELIPDEYEHEDNQNGVVLIFYSENDEENMKMLQKALRYQGYDVPYSNLYEISTKEYVLESLEKAAQDVYQDKTCLILVFMGRAGIDSRIFPDKESEMKNSIPIRDIWSLFTSDRCPSLKNKPKMFIFQANKDIEMVSCSDTTDGIENDPPGAYDIPAEADILLIYKKNEIPGARKHFIQQFCNNLCYDGHKEDIIGLVTHTDYQDGKRPVIISTMTRKFYIKSSNNRGHHHDLTDIHNLVAEKLKDVKEKITMLETQNAFAHP